MKITEEQILPAYIEYYAQMASVREDPMTFAQFTKRFLDKSQLELEGTKKDASQVRKTT